MDLDVQKGTYTGDPTKDGSVVCTSVSQVDKEKMGKLMMGAVMSGQKSLKITNSNCPLVALDSSKVETRECTISGTTLTVTKAANTHENNLFRVYFFSTQASLAWIFFRVYTNLKKL